MAIAQRISPCLWFDDQGEEAAEHYVSIFPNSKIGKIGRYGKEGFEIHHKPEGAAMTVVFTLDGQEFMALNGGPQFKFNEAISLIVNCETQDELDYYWNKLGAGGDPKAQVCGWLKDKFGLSWQIVPIVLQKLITDPDKAKAGRTMKALMEMKKLDIAALQRAHDSK
jgi:predicted 3-demethylubiquinone-9 3-methyltransferase (glyoxalase superfamily)